MKRIKVIRKTITILSMLALVITGYCQTEVQLPNRSGGDYLTGKHFPLIYTGEGLIKGSSNHFNTPWCQVGFSPSAVDSDNRNVGLFNQEVFTVSLKLGCYGSGDSAHVSTAFFKCAYDTTMQPLWNADTSNVFIGDGNFSHDQYGFWRFESLEDTSKVWFYSIKVLTGRYVCLVLECDHADTCQIDWKLICEH